MTEKKAAKEKAGKPGKGEKARAGKKEKAGEKEKKEEKAKKVKGKEEAGKVKAEKKEKKKAEEAAKASKQEQLAAYEVIRYPLITEKSVGMIESENKLVFVVNGKASKADVKKAVESLYGVKVDKVNTLRDMKARKRAFVKINEKYNAEDIATKLGML